MHRSSYSEYDRRGGSSHSEAQVERGVLDLLEKIRRCKGYLTKRLRHIEDSGQTRLLRDQVQSIKYWLEIAAEVRADMIYGVDTLKVVYNDLMEMIRLNPIQEEFNSSRLDESDEDDDAPRSPSPSANEIDEGPRVIPMERSSDDYNRRDYMTSSNRSSETSTRSGGGHDNYSTSGDWGMNDYNRRVQQQQQQQQQQQHCDRDIFKMKGDTDMRFDSFSTDTISIGRGRGLIRNDIDRRTPWNNNTNNNSSSSGAMDNSYVRERSDDRNSGRQFDHHNNNRRRDPSDERERFGSGFNRGGGDVRSRETNRDFYGDEDLRDLSNDRMRDISRSRVGGDYYERRERNDFSEYNNSNNININNTDQDPWTSAINSQHHQQHQHHLQQQQQQQQHLHQQQQHLSNLNSQNPFAMNDNLNAAAAAAIQLQSFGFPMSGFPGLQNVPMNLLQAQAQQQQIGNNSPLPNLSGFGTQSSLINPGFPINSNNTVGSRLSSSSSPSTLIHPPISNSQNFNNNPIGQTHLPFGSPPLGGIPLRHPNPSATTTTTSSSSPSNLFDQTRQDNNNSGGNSSSSRMNDLFRQKASQYFNIRQNSRPRAPQPGHNTNNNNRDISNNSSSSNNVANNQSNSNKPPTSVGSNTTLNPNLATNQIVADLPNDPRRRSQLERQKQLQQKQQQQQQSTSRSSNNNNNKNNNSGSSGSKSLDPRSKHHQSKSSRLASPPSSPDNINPDDHNNNANDVDEEDYYDQHHEDYDDNRDDNVGSSSSSGINSKKKREALHKPTSPTRKNLKQTVERVREKVAGKVQPKVSKLQQIREEFGSNPVYRLGTKSKNIEDCVVQTQSEVSSEKSTRRTSPRRDKSMTSDDNKSTNNNNASNSSSSNNNSGSSKQKQTRNATSKTSNSSKESKSKRDKSPPKKNDRKAKQKQQQYSDNEEEQDESEEEKSPTRKTTRKKLTGSTTTEKSKDVNAGASTNETQKISFRIPKIRKPPTPSPSPPPPIMEDEDSDHHHEEDDSLLVHEDESLHENNNNNTMEVETNNTTSTNEDVSVSSSSITEATASSSKTSNNNVDFDTDALLRNFIVKAVGLKDDRIDQIMNDPSNREKLKRMLTDKIAEIAEVSLTSDPPSSPVVDQIKTESIEPVEESGRLATSPNRVENEDGPTARGRATTRKKPTKRRSSLEKLHDALREMNFDADLTSISRRPRRGATNRGLVEENIEHPSSSSTGINSTLETVVPQQSTIDEVIESVANDNISSSGGDSDMDESSTSNTEIGKGGNKNKSRKRKRVSIVGAGKRRAKKSTTTTTATTISGNESTLNEAEAIAAVAAVRDFEDIFTGEAEEEGEEEMEIPQPPTKTTPKKKGTASGGKKKSKKSPTKADTSTKSTNNNNTTNNDSQEQQSNKRKRGDVQKKVSTEPPAEGRVLRPRGSINATNSGQTPSLTRIQQPNVFINPLLMKIKMEGDYVPVRGVKVEISDPSLVNNLINNQVDETDDNNDNNNNDDDNESVEDNDIIETLATPSTSIASSSSSSKGKNSKKTNLKSGVEEKGMTNVEPDKEQLRMSDISYDKSVFLGSSSPENQDSQEVHVPSHEKLLTDPGAPFIVKKIFPSNLFDFYLEDVFKVDGEENEVKLNQQDDEKVSDKITKECKETLDWMLSVIQFRNDQDSISLCSDSDDVLDLCNEVLDNSILNTKKTSVASSSLCDLDDDDDDDEDYEEMEQEEEVENESDSSISSRSNNNNNQKSNLEQNGNTNSSNKISLDSEIEKEKDSSDESTNQNLEEKLRTCSLSKDGMDLDKFPKDDKGEISGGDSSNQDDEEGEVGRTTNLEGTELYRCANENCVFTASNATSFKEHSFTCPNLPANKQTQCIHCDKKLKSAGSLLEHLKIHGKPRQVCSLCPFRCWISSELTKHLKNTHKVYNCKVVKEVIEGEDPIFIMYSKEVAHKMAQPNDLKRNHILYTSKVQFGPDDIESIPRPSIFTTLVHCSECEYSSKVRSNIVRHLKLHQISNEDNGKTNVPCKAPVNPVPCLERKELMFDKMTNWAGSSHDHNKVGGVSKEDSLKLPKFVTDQFRYMCSVESCKQITGQDDILCSHMKALHFKEKYYLCPHCQEDDVTKKDPRNSVLIDKIQHHLKLHGPRLSKCGHCDYIHYSSTSMEKHVATKHVEKKPIFYLIRDYDNDGNPMNRRPSVEDSTKGKNERWRCNLCKASLNSWDDAKQHCTNSHKSKNQFECSACHFGSDSIYAISNHMSTSCQTTQSQQTPKPQIMIMFHRNENYESSESKLDDGVNIPIWRRDAPRVKHIRGIFLEEDSKPSGSNSNAQKAPPQPKPPVNPSVTVTPKQPSQPTLLVCPKCKMFKTKNTVDMKVHLFNEFNYQRYKCTICETKFVTVDSLKAHMSNDHKYSIDEESKAELPTNPKIETKVYDIINGQLKNSEQNLDDKDGRNVEILLCKHCFTLFSSFHNYRTHILAKHIGGERFRCKYCPGLGFWHEAMLRQHHQKSSHADKPLDAVRNTEFEETLSPEFWFNEYGIPLHKSINSVNSSRSIKQEVDDTWLKCSQCEFTTESSSSLRAHEVRHSNDRKSPTKRKRLSISDGQKSEMLTSTTIKKEPGATIIKREPGGTTPEMKRNNNMSSVFNCSNCENSFFTKRGVRRHWVRAHSLDELPCRYYEVKSQSKNLTIMDGVCMLCRHCYYESSDAGHFQSHHEREHPTLPVRYKRKKRTIDSNSDAATILVCSHCYCEFETLHKLKLHSQDKHTNSQLKYKSQVNNFVRHPVEAVAKLLEDTVVIECTFCLQECGTRTKYENHYKSYHGDQEYAAPNFKYSRSVLIEDGISSGIGDDEVGQNSPSKGTKVRRMSVVVNNNNNNIEESSTTTTATSRSTVIKSINNNNKPVVKNTPPPPPPPVLHSCPKCEFQTTSLDTLASSHLLTHLLNYLCPICGIGFHGTLDALFHIRHYHGEHRLLPTHDPAAYIEFTTLKNQVTAHLKNSAPTSNFSAHDILTINLSDEDDTELDDDLTLLDPVDLDDFDNENFQLVSL